MGGLGVAPSGCLNGLESLQFSNPTLTAVPVPSPILLVSSREASMGHTFSVNSVKDVENGGFFAALDKMEKGELESKLTENVCPIEASLELTNKIGEGTGMLE